MELTSIGHEIAQRRRAMRISVADLASRAHVGRSTLAALEAGTIAELGFVKVVRICAAVGLSVETRAAALDSPLMSHRHLTESAGRNLTKAAIADVVVRGDVAAWRGLVRAIQGREQGELTRRTQEVVAALDADDPKVRAFAALLPELLRRRRRRSARNA